MPLALRSTVETYSSIDEILGDGRRRFFSHGYKNTHPKLQELRVAHTVAESSLTAVAALGLQGAWSVKGVSEQSPHLGTTDVLVLACRMAEALLASRYSPEILPEAHLTSVTISGGSEPVEGLLSNLECVASLQTMDDGTSVLQCTVASMSAELVVAHSSSDLGLASIQSPSEDALVGDAATRLYGTLWAERQVSLLNVAVDSEDGTGVAKASATVTFSQGGPEVSSKSVSNKSVASRLQERCGLEAAYPQAFSPIEHFVATLQLGQVLLYRLDDMSRASSNTLWMRKTRIKLPRPAALSDSGTALGVQLRKSRLIVMDGESWRCADVVGTFDGGEVVCSVAHQVPAELAANTAGTGQ